MVLKKNLDDLKLERRFIYRKKNVFSAKEISIPGSKFQVVYFDPASSIDPHYHKVATEIYHVTAGSGTFSINGRKIRAGIGVCFIIHPNDIHAISAGKKGLTIAIFKYNESADDIYWVKSIL